MPDRVELDQDKSDFSVFKSCSHNYYYTRQARFHHSQPIAITIAVFEVTYINASLIITSIK